MLSTALSLLESQIEVSGVCILGKDTAGNGIVKELSLSQARTLLNVADGADATGYLGSMSTSARNFLTGMVAGNWIWNTDWGMRQDKYDGQFWLGPREIVLTNRTGGDSVAGKSWIVSPNYDFAVANPGIDDNIRIAGTVVTGGVADGNPVVVSVPGVLSFCLMAANDNTVRGNGIYAWANGENSSSGWTGDNTGCHAIALESKNDASVPYLVTCLVGIPAEIY